MGSGEGIIPSFFSRKSIAQYCVYCGYKKYVTPECCFNTKDQIMNVGDRVRAVTQIAESDFNDEETWIHANIGDLGHVVHISDTGYPTVLFDKTHTATVVAPTEIELST
jgi:hypothetical protein